MLRAHKVSQDEAKRRAGDAYADNDLVFCNPDGSPWPPDTLSKQFADIAKLVGMQGFRFHDLRHAFATLALADGRPIKEVQVLMGHSTANTTLSFYARWSCPYETGHAAGDELAWMNSRGESILSPLCGWLLL